MRNLPFQAKILYFSFNGQEGRHKQLMATNRFSRKIQQKPRMKDLKLKNYG